MALKSKEIVLHELDKQISAHEAVIKAWAQCPYPELLHDEARRSNSLSLHFQNARRAVEMYG